LPDAVRRAQLVPQAVHNLVFAQTGRSKGWGQTSQFIESGFLI